MSDIKNSFWLSNELFLITASECEYAPTNNGHVIYARRQFTVCAKLEGKM